jgi:hypothetical protein
VQLLADCQGAFLAAGNPDQLTTKALIDYLTGLEEAPWGAWNDGAGIKARELANKLRRYEIRSRDLWTDDRSLKGYRRADFEDSWARHVHAREPAPPDSKRESRENGSPKPETAPFLSAREESHRGCEDAHKPHEHADLADLADKSRGQGNGVPDDDLSDLELDEGELARIRAEKVPDTALRALTCECEVPMPMENPIDGLYCVRCAKGIES